MAQVPDAVKSRGRVDSWQKSGTWIVSLDGVDATPAELGWPGGGTIKVRALIFQVDLVKGQVEGPATILREPLAPLRPAPLPQDALPPNPVGTPIPAITGIPTERQGAIDWPLRGMPIVPPAIPEPNTFSGRVWINGLPAPDGTIVEAVVGGLVCDRRETVAGQYRVTIVEGYSGLSGDTVRFSVNGRWAEQEGKLIHPLMGWYLDLGVPTLPGQ